MGLIYLDAWGVKHGPHGISRYCRSLIPPLVAAAPDHAFVILRPPLDDPDDRLDPSGAACEVPIRLPQTDWATLAFRPFLESAFARFGRPDLYHSLFHMLPIGLTRGSRAPRAVVVTLHDLISIDYPSGVKRSRIAIEWVKRFDRAVIPSALRHADHVICVSDATRTRAVEWVPEERSTTVHSGVADATAELLCTGRPHGVDPASPYIAALGPARPYKNVACIVRAVDALRATRPDLRLVLIGGDGGDGAAAAASKVVVTPAIDDADLRTIVRGARVFVVASRAEGFGLPLLEAMAAGTPVAASDIPALREVGGDAALWFDPENPTGLASVVGRLLDDPALRAEMIARGRARAARFPWSRTAAATLAVYDRVLAAAGDRCAIGVSALPV